VASRSPSTPSSSQAIARKDLFNKPCFVVAVLAAPPLCSHCPPPSPHSLPILFSRSFLRNFSPDTMGLFPSVCLPFSFPLKAFLLVIPALCSTLSTQGLLSSCIFLLKSAWSPPVVYASFPRSFHECGLASMSFRASQEGPLFSLAAPHSALRVSPVPSNQKPLPRFFLPSFAEKRSFVPMPLSFFHGLFVPCPCPGEFRRCPYLTFDCTARYLFFLSFSFLSSV